MTSPSDIPDAAVEAAAKVVYRTSGRMRVMTYEHARPACEEDAISILEAAAPHMLTHQTLNQTRSEWERCPKRHSSPVQHAIDCETEPTP